MRTGAVAINPSDSDAPDFFSSSYYSYSGPSSGEWDIYFYSFVAVRVPAKGSQFRELAKVGTTWTVKLLRCV